MYLKLSHLDPPLESPVIPGKLFTVFQLNIEVLIVITKRNGLVKEARTPTANI